MSRIAVIIVTHNSEAVIGRCVAALEKQAGPPVSVIVVDSGSRDQGYLRVFADRPRFEVLEAGNVGFSRANNLGYQHLAADVEYVVFLNPDVFLEPDAILEAVRVMDRDPLAACLTGRLLGFIPGSGGPSGRLDSTGIFRKWYGRWYDRGQGEEDRGQYGECEYVPAACGAFMFCRKAALDQAGPATGQVFDADFFLYKEDIELSLRLRKKGWRIAYHPGVRAFHCRGWLTGRRRVPYKLRRMSARNEVVLYRKHPSVYMGWALFKCGLVTLFRL